MFADEEGYVTSVVIGGTPLDTDNVATLLAELDESIERVSEEEVAEAMKALRNMDDGDEDQIIFYLIQDVPRIYLSQRKVCSMSGKRQKVQP